MATMYELTRTWLDLLELADDPEVDSQAIADTFESISGEVDYKADCVAKVLCELDAKASGIKEQEERLKLRRQHIQMTADSLKKQLKNMMEVTGKRKIQTDLFSFSIQKNGGKLPLIIDVDVNDLPSGLVIMERKVNTDALRAVLDSGQGCKYAHYGERGETIRIK